MTKGLSAVKFASLMIAYFTIRSSYQIELENDQEKLTSLLELVLNFVKVITK